MGYKKCFAEFIGTFFLVFIGSCSIIINVLSKNSIGHTGVALTFGFIIFIMIFACGDISGAHFNPAVTIAFYISGKLKIKYVLPYIISQLLGAVVASALLKMIFGEISRLAITLPSLDISQKAVPISLVLEVIFTCLLMFVIMSVGDQPKVGNYLKIRTAISGLVIGSIVFLGALIAGPISGGSFNPARSLGPSIVSSDYRYIWIYIVAPMTGACLGASLYLLEEH